MTQITQCDWCSQPITAGQKMVTWTASGTDTATRGDFHCDNDLGEGKSCWDSVQEAIYVARPAPSS